MATLPAHPHDDWLAQQYVLGELSPAARTRFEARLADNPELCQRLADAMLLFDALGVNAPVTQRSTPAAPRRSWASVAAVLTASVCLLLAWLPSTRSTSQRDSSAVQLVSLWRVQADLPRLAALTDVDFEEEPGWSCDQVPRWMIAAVSLERGLAPATESDEAWEDN